MCPWVWSHVPSCGRQLWGLPSRMEYLSPQGVLLPQVYGKTASPLRLELRGPAAWQAMPSWAVCRHACYQLLPWLRATFVMVPDAAWPGSDQRPWSTAPATGPVGKCNGHMHAQGRCTHAQQAQRAHTAVALADGVLFVCLIDCYQGNRD